MKNKWAKNEQAMNEEWMREWGLPRLPIPNQIFSTKNEFLKWTSIYDNLRAPQSHCNHQQKQPLIWVFLARWSSYARVMWLSYQIVRARVLWLSYARIVYSSVMQPLSNQRWEDKLRVAMVTKSHPMPRNMSIKIQVVNESLSHVL